ncbi:MAG: aminotransferase class V-fold PLP-dependent enzyme [Candidatus Brocadiales bacterium]|nr:aminotransferase class V-fold PLP-dependent enzyme [Candidatus Brocadiales bacterium]MBL7005941.1 aminotransferase class V-fold PLP-dependent enzyme [Spirochaetia bacterium]
MNCYLDWASTTPVHTKVLEKYIEISKAFPGNPSSQHAEGKKAGIFLSNLRAKTAEIMGISAENLIFTSGGTESNTLMHTSLLRNKRRGEIIISGIDHPSVFEYENIYKDFGFVVKILRAPDGYIDLGDFEKNLSEKTQFISIMLVNNVTGTIQPIEELVKITRMFERKKGIKIHFHTDAVQALGKIDYSLKNLDVDSASFSAHKIQGPKGTGMLFAKKFPQMIQSGGGQEFSFRHGTESLALISASYAGLLQVTRNYYHNYKNSSNLQNIIINTSKNSPELFTLPINYENNKAAPNITTICCRAIPAEVITRVMNDRGFSISAGSACSSKDRKKRERVLHYMGFDTKAASTAIRISTGPTTSSEQVQQFCNTLHNEVKLLHKMLGKR